MLLELGLDPDERGTLEGLEETVPTWGAPLRECAIRNSIEAATILLAHGANPNTGVYAASSAVFEAHKRRHTDIVALLEGHGGQLSPVAVAELGMVDRAAALLVEPADAPRPEGFIAPGSSIASELTWGAMGYPSPAIVRLGLSHLDWSRDDRRWHGLLVNGLYLRPDSDRAGHLEAFRLVLELEPNLGRHLGPGRTRWATQTSVRCCPRPERDAPAPSVLIRTRRSGCLTCTGAAPMLPTHPARFRAGLVPFPKH